MEQLDLDKILKASVILITSNHEKTLSARTIQTIFRILYMDSPMLKNGIINGTKYCTKYTSSDSNVKLNSFAYINNHVKNFMNTEALEMYNDKLRTSPNAVAYLCGLYDTFNNNVQQLGNN